jgi:hypothetical protein
MDAGLRYPEYYCTFCHIRIKGKTIWERHELSHQRDADQSPISDQRRKGWGCGFCTTYLDHWEKRSHHIGRHFESGSNITDWQNSNVIRGLLRQPELNGHWRKLLVENHGPLAESRILIRFDEPKKERSGLGLQYMLEFGAHNRDVQAVVQSAYDLGVRPHLNDTAGFTVAKLEGNSKLSNLPSEDLEKDSDRYVVCHSGAVCNSGLADAASPTNPPGAEIPARQSLQDHSTILPRKPSVELEPELILASQTAVGNMPNDFTSNVDPAQPVDLSPLPAKSEISEDTSLESDTWSTYSDFTDSASVSNSGRSDMPAHHENISRIGKGSKVDQKPYLRSLVGSKRGINEYASRDDSISAGSKHSASHSSSSSSYSGLRKRDGRTGVSGGRKIGGEDDDDDDDGYGKNNTFHSEIIPGLRRLACPYFKRNPDRYSGTKYRMCQYSGFATVHRLK